MGRKRALSDLRDDTYKRADCEGATDRHPLEDVNRYINQGRAAFRDRMIVARGRSYFRAETPQTITTVDGQTKYDLEEDFYQLISVRLDETDWSDLLQPFTAQDEPFLRYIGPKAEWPTHYELQATTIELLPIHRAGVSVVVEYIQVLEDLVDDADEADGINGWEDYIVDYAAMQMAVKDDEQKLISNLERSLARLEARIASLAPKRDRFRAERVKDVRNERLYFGRFR